MRNYWIAFIVVMLFGVGGFGAIIYKCARTDSDSETKYLYYLNTINMKEAGQEIIDSTAGPGVIKILPCYKTNTRNDTIPWADLYICKSYDKLDSLAGDTALILLDVQTKTDLANIGDPGIFWTGIKAAKRFRKCKVLISKNEINILNNCNYKYKYASVTLVTDDYNR